MYGVFGLGKSGFATLEYLDKQEREIWAWDDNTKSQEQVSRRFASDSNITLAKIEAWPWQEIKTLVLAPGVPLTHPKPHPVVELAQQHGCNIICDIELLYLANPGATYIGITGTNGKSTTTALIGHILQEAGFEVAVGGNIGEPALSLPSLGKEGIYVLEMSSYQLDLIKQTHFSISVLLNITPDHLDRHGDMAGYTKAKCHIFDNQNVDDFAVIGIDNSHSCKVYRQLKDRNEGAKPIAISVRDNDQADIIVMEDILLDGNQTYPLGKLPYLPGAHNAENIAAAYAVAKQCKLEPEVIIENIKTFKGLPHRVQRVDHIKGVTFINDSKATNAEAASKALNSFDNIYWIVGGLAKAGGIDSLASLFDRVAKAYLIGEAADDFAKCLQKEGVAFEICGTLEKAFTKASEDAMLAAGSKPYVLLSPACASFDQWPNFEARGEAFCHMVESYAALHI